jgi:hypothetical protein
LIKIIVEIDGIRYPADTTGTRIARSLRRLAAP